MHSLDFPDRGFGCGHGAPGAAQAPAAPTQAQALAAIRAFAPVAMERQGTPGLSVAITTASGTIDVITLGYANVDAKAPVTPSTRFAVGSITKSMTALALLQLYDAGRFRLDAPVKRYLPWFSIDSNGKPILMHQILSHTAGLPDDFSSEPGYRYDVVALAKARTLYAPALRGRIPTTDTRRPERCCRRSTVARGANRSKRASSIRSG